MYTLEQTEPGFFVRHPPGNVNSMSKEVRQFKRLVVALESIIIMTSVKILGPEEESLAHDGVEKLIKVDYN
jgi:hypothetical protein